MCLFEFFDDGEMLRTDFFAFSAFGALVGAHAFFNKELSVYISHSLYRIAKGNAVPKPEDCGNFYIRRTGQTVATGCASDLDFRVVQFLCMPKGFFLI